MKWILGYLAFGLLSGVLAYRTSTKKASDLHADASVTAALALIFWPLGLPIVLAIGAGYLLTGSGGNTGPTRRQRRKFEFHERELAILRKRNDETERAMRILRGED